MHPLHGLRAALLPCLLAAAMSPAAAGAATDNPLVLGKQEIYEQSLAALTQLFVIALLMESAFATIFNWRVFLAYFSRTGVKTLVMIVASLVVVNVFEADILASLLSAYKAVPVPSGPVSRLVTALILAGGSAGVYNLMKTLGLRSDTREEEVRARPARDKAWLAVRIQRRKAAGPVFVKIKNLGPLNTYAGASPPMPIVGTVAFSRRSLADLMLRRTDRFPENGGYELQPDVAYELTVEGIDSAGAALGWPTAPMVFALAPGAIVDLTASL